MPQNDAVSKAKSVLADADKFEKSADPTGAQKPQPIAMPEKPAVSAKAGAGLGAELGSKARNVTEYEKAVPKYHKGGTVKETGLAELEKGETVRTKEQEKSVEEKPKKEKKASPEALMTSEDKGPKKEAKSEKKDGKKGGGFTETRVHHLNAGGHHVHHVHKDGSDKDMHYAAADLEAVKQGLQNHIGGGASAAMEPPEPAPNAEQAAAMPPAGTPPAATAMPQQV